MKPNFTFTFLIVSVLLAACRPSPPTASPDKPLFFDDFTQDNGLWEIFTEDGATAQIAAGQLTLANTRPATIALSVAALNVGDFDLTVAATFVEGGSANSYGVIFRYLNEKMFYRLDLTGDGYWGVSRRLEDNWISVSELTASPAIRTGPGATNLIRLVALTANFTIYANDQLLGTVSDTTLTIGRIGLLVSTFDEPTVQAQFDNVRVVKP